MFFVAFAAFWREQGFSICFFVFVVVFYTLVAHACLSIVRLRYFCASRVSLVFLLLLICLLFYEMFVNGTQVFAHMSVLTVRLHFDCQHVFPLWISS